MKTNIRVKALFPFTVKDMKGEDDSSEITGYASTFDNLDHHYHIMKKGCFDDTLKSTSGKWPVKLEHQDIIGMNKSATVDKKGLYIESALFSNDNDLPKAKEAYALVKNCLKFKHPLGLSVGGIISNMKFGYKKGIGLYVEILGFDIMEHSITGTPANPQARIQSSKEIKELVQKSFASCHNNKNNLDWLQGFDIERKAIEDFLKENRSSQNILLDKL